MTTPGTRQEPLRIGNGSAFYGDRFAAMREMLDGGPLDVLTGDYLAELTMLILWKQRRKDASRGYASTFLAQMEELLGRALERGVRIVTNAGGLNPGGLATALRALGERLGLRPRVAHLEGDDILERLPALQQAGHALCHLDTGQPLATLDSPPLTANVYLGAFGIAEALAAGADIVVCPRVTDAALVMGPAAWHFGWRRTDHHALAGALVAGHILECGPQATGGNYAFFEELGRLDPPGFPIAEVHADGSAVITKHPGTGGEVSIGTVTAQLLYEIDAPSYASPDVVARFDSVQLEQVGVDRVRVHGVRGEPPPATAKVCINYLGGHRNLVTFYLTGLCVEEKAARIREMLFARLGGEARFGSVDVRLIRTDRPDARSGDEATATLRICVKDRDPAKVGRAFADAATELAVSSVPGLYLGSPPREATAYGVLWPALLAASEVHEEVVDWEGRRRVVPPAEPLAEAPGAEAPAAETAAALRLSGGESAAGPGGTRTVPLGRLFGTRSGDKGGNANVGVWARSDRAYAWLRRWLTVARLRELVPEAEALEVRRYELANLRALNFVVVGLLGEGVASSTRPDAQAKGLGEYLRSRPAEVPAGLLDEDQASGRRSGAPRGQDRG